ncbi:MAG: metallophosphoesterase, partial [Prevotella sp.]|nr:metallophosphoesterase [Prevotella sp.]
MSKKLLSMLLVLVMVLSIVAPVILASATESETATVSEPTSDLRIGVLSDIHVSYDYVDETYGSVSGYFNGVQPSRFEKALRFYKSQGVDAVVIAGDLQEASGTDAASLDKQKDWLQTVVDIWFKVFPEEKGEEGYVEPIFTYGNHDSALVGAQYWPEEWGTYEDVFVKEVNGYSFVCTHNAKEHLAAPLLADVVPSNQDKPVFYIQHCPVYNTVPSSTGGYGVGYGQNGWSNVAPYHNVVVLNGHTHVPLTDERSIWQGDAGNEGQFTVLNTATINYSGLGNDDMSINGFNGNAQQTEHGLLIDVNGSDVTVDRYSFNDMTIDTATGTVSGNVVKLGETWQ